MKEYRTTEPLVCKSRKRIDRTSTGKTWARGWRSIESIESCQTSWRKEQKGDRVSERKRKNKMRRFFAVDWRDRRPSAQRCGICFSTETAVRKRAIQICSQKAWCQNEEKQRVGATKHPISCKSYHEKPEEEQNTDIYVRGKRKKWWKKPVLLTQNDSGCSVHYTTNYFRFFLPLVFIRIRSAQSEGKFSEPINCLANRSVPFTITIIVGSSLPTS